MVGVAGLRHLKCRCAIRESQIYGGEFYIPIGIFLILLEIAGDQLDKDSQCDGKEYRYIEKRNLVSHRILITMSRPPAYTRPG